MMVPLGPRAPRVLYMQPVRSRGGTVFMFTFLYMPATRSEKLEKGEDAPISQLTAAMNSPARTTEQ